MDARTKAMRPQQQRQQQERSLDQDIHVIVHLPFKRPESFADHEVFWNADMEQTLWRLLGQVPPSAVDWPAVSRQLNNVPVSFLIRHAAYLYQIRLQDLHRLDEQHQQQLLQQQQNQQQQQQHGASIQEDSRSASSRPASKTRVYHSDKDAQTTGKSPTLGGSVSAFNPSGSVISARPPSISSSASTIRAPANPPNSSSVAPSPVIKNSNLPGAMILHQNQQPQLQIVTESLTESTRGVQAHSPIQDGSLHLTDSSVFPPLPHSSNTQSMSSQGQQYNEEHRRSQPSISKRMRSPPLRHQPRQYIEGDTNRSLMSPKEPAHPFNKATLFASQILHPPPQHDISTTAIDYDRGAENNVQQSDKAAAASNTYSQGSNILGYPDSQQQHHGHHSHHQQQHPERSSMTTTTEHSDRSSSMASTPFSQSNSTSQIFEETSFFNQLSSNDSLSKGIDGLLERALWDQRQHQQQQHPSRQGMAAPLPSPHHYHQHHRHSMHRSFSGSQISSPEEPRMGLGLTGVGLSSTDSRSPSRGTLTDRSRTKGGDGSPPERDDEEESEMDDDESRSSTDREAENERLLRQQIKQLHLDEELAFLPQGGSGGSSSIHGGLAGHEMGAAGVAGGPFKGSPRPPCQPTFAPPQPLPPTSLPAKSSFSSPLGRAGGGRDLRDQVSSSAAAYNAHDRIMMPFQLDDELANLGTRALEELSADDDGVDPEEDDHRILSGVVIVDSDRPRQRRGSRHHAPPHHYQQHYLPRRQQSLSTEGSQGSSPTRIENPQQQQYNSVVSSFSDLSDSSITQSAMEDAYLSNFNTSKTSLFMHASTRN